MVFSKKVIDFNIIIMVLYKSRKITKKIKGENNVTQK